MRTIQKLFIIIIFFIPGIILGATPTITHIDGVVCSGQTLTINGSNLSTENTADWTISKESGSFELGPAGGYVGSYGSIDGWQPYGGGGSPVFYDSNEKLLGKQSMRGDIIGRGKLGAVTYISYTYEKPEMYFRYYFKYPVGYQWPNNFQKQAIIGHSYIQPLNFNPTTKYLTGYCGDQRNAVTLPSHLHGGRLKDGRWYCVEVRIKQGTSFNPASNDAQTQVWIDGIEVSNFDNVPNNTSQEWGGFQLGLINGATFINANSSFWMDGVAVSTSRIFPAAMVEIGDNSNYATATKVKQPLRYISDNQIKISTDLSALGSGPYYLFITNNTQEKSAAHLLTFDRGVSTPPIISTSDHSPL